VLETATVEFPRGRKLLSGASKFLLVLVLAIGCLAAPFTTAGTPPATERCEMPSLAGMLERVLPGVVSITFEESAPADNPLLSDPVLRRFFGLPEQSQPGEFQIGGSGIIVDAARGYVLTSHHLLEGTEDVTVRLSDGRKLQARKIGSDSPMDIAVLQIPAEGLTAVPLGDSAQVTVGDYIVTVGSPFGLDQSVTSGIVSALGRTGIGIRAYENFIQIDAAVNPGSSGGALVNLRGELVGINTAIVSPSGSNVGIGLAVPINMARQVMGQLVAYGKVSRGQLGITVQDLTPELAGQLKIDVREGALVDRVSPKSPAEQAGMAAGDVVTGVNGERVRNSADLRNVVGLLRAGSRVQLDFVREGTRKQVTAYMAVPMIEKVDIPSKVTTLAGVTLGTIEPESPLYGRIDGAVVVAIKPGSKAEKAGLRSGDTIVGIGQEPIKSPSDVVKMATAAKGKLQLRVLRNGSALSIVIG
jgi:serine protease Do/serine protease DegQ